LYEKVSDLKFPTLDDVDVSGKTVLVRVDINSPIDPKTGEILDDTRIRECAPTIKELSEKCAKVVVLAHQGRPGDEDFTSLEKHSKKLSVALGQIVIFVGDVFGQSALKAIESLGPGEVLLLDNVRFCEEENITRPPEEAAKTKLVSTLAALADIYVTDAFASAHRSQASLVGFSVLLPTYAGRLMEREINGLSRALSPERPCVYVLGGAKVDDSLKIIEHVLGRGVVDEVLTGGLLGHAFLAASGRDIGESNRKLIEKDFAEEIELAKKSLSTYDGRIKVPQDVVVDDHGRPKELDVKRLPTEFLLSDIGAQTIKDYSKSIARAKTVVANGPLGIFENRIFAKGTFEILKAMARSKAFTVIGGGHMVAAAQELGVTDKIKHISTGGKACISFLSGDKLPVIEMLIHAKN
jgi:phosphoglycerate kinase